VCETARTYERQHHQQAEHHVHTCRSVARATRTGRHTRQRRTPATFTRSRNFVKKVPLFWEKMRSGYVGIHAMRWSIRRSLSTTQTGARFCTSRPRRPGGSGSERTGSGVPRDDDERARFSQVTHSRAPVTAKKYGAVTGCLAAAEIKGEQGPAEPKAEREHACKRTSRAARCVSQSGLAGDVGPALRAVSRARWQAPPRQRPSTRPARWSTGSKRKKVDLCAVFLGTKRSKLDLGLNHNTVELFCTTLAWPPSCNLLGKRICEKR
jgi:hypothetical protein